MKSLTHYLAAALLLSKSTEAASSKDSQIQALSLDDHMCLDCSDSNMMEQEEQPAEAGPVEEVDPAVEYLGDGELDVESDSDDSEDEDDDDDTEEEGFFSGLFDGLFGGDAEDEQYDLATDMENE